MLNYLEVKKVVILKITGNISPKNIKEVVSMATIDRLVLDDLLGKAKKIQQDLGALTTIYIGVLTRGNCSSKQQQQADGAAA